MFCSEVYYEEGYGSVEKTVPLLCQSRRDQTNAVLSRHVNAFQKGQDRILRHRESGLPTLSCAVWNHSEVVLGIGINVVLLLLIDILKEAGE